MTITPGVLASTSSNMSCSKIMRNDVLYEVGSTAIKEKSNDKKILFSIKRPQ